VLCRYGVLKSAKFFFSMWISEVGILVGSSVGISRVTSKIHVHWLPQAKQHAYRFHEPSHKNTKGIVSDLAAILSEKLDAYRTNGMDTNLACITPAYSTRQLDE
jgi:hypothetical protein